MKYRVLAALLAVLMVLALGACGGKAPAQDPEKKGGPVGPQDPPRDIGTAPGARPGLNDPVTDDDAGQEEPEPEPEPGSEPGPEDKAPEDITDYDLMLAPSLAEKLEFDPTAHPKTMADAFRYGVCLDCFGKNAYQQVQDAYKALGGPSVDGQWNIPGVTESGAVLYLTIGIHDYVPAAKCVPIEEARSIILDICDEDSVERDALLYAAFYRYYRDATKGYSSITEALSVLPEKEYSVWAEKMANTPVPEPPYSETEALTIVRGWAETGDAADIQTYANAMEEWSQAEMDNANKTLNELLSVITGGN